jgi:hypothetical protein
LEQIEEGIAQDSLPDDEPPTPINSAESEKRIAELNRENRSKAEEKAIKYLLKLMEYEKHLSRFRLWKPLSNTTVFIRNRPKRSKTTVLLHGACITTGRKTASYARWDSR